MQQKFISHPDQSTILDLSKVHVINRSHFNQKAALVFSTFGSEDRVEWVFDTHEQARDVYDWVLSQLPVVHYSQFGPVQEIKDLINKPPSAFAAELAVSEHHFEITPPMPPERIELSNLYRGSVVIDGINRPIRKFYFGLTDGSVDVIISELQAMPVDARFTLADINCANHATAVMPLLMDLGCVTAGEGAWEKTQIPF